jgi:hypothetical protein
MKNRPKEFKKIALFLLVFTLLPSFVAALNSTDLVIHYSMDNADISGATLADLAGNYPGTIGGANLIGLQGLINQSIGLSFGQTSYITTNTDCSAVLKGDQATIMVILKPIQLDNGGVIFSCYDGASEANRWDFQYVSAVNGLRLFYAADGTNINSTFSTVNDWVFVGLTQNGDNHTLFINGLPVDSANIVGKDLYDVGNYDLRLGRSITTNTLNASFDDFYVWNRSLSYDEVYNTYIELFNVGNFSITPTDIYNGSSINISALINGTIYFYNATTQTIPTDIDKSAGLLYNITLFDTNGLYLNKTYPNYNTSINLNAGLHFYKSRHLINATIAPLNSTAITTFNISVDGVHYGNTTTGEIVVPTTWNTSSDITIYASGYEIKTYTTNGTTNEAHQFNLYTTNSFNLRFKNEITNTLINELINFELISDIFGGNYTTTNGTLYIDLLMPADYIMRYGGEDYTTRFYYTTLTQGTSTTLDLYLLPKTQTYNVTATVITNTNDELEGATINVQKYDITTNTYKTVERVNTNYEGKAIIHTTQDEFYKFVVEYNGNTVLSTSATYILEDAITLVVDISEDPTETFYQELGISYNLYFQNNKFYTTYTNGGAASQLCLKVYRKAHTGNIFIQQSCSTSNSATLLVDVTPVNGTTYTGKFYATIGGDERFLKSLDYSYNETNVFGTMGLLILLMLTLVFVFFGYWAGGAVFALILTPIPLIILSMLQVIAIPVAVAISVEVAFLIGAAFIGGKS